MRALMAFSIMFDARMLLPLLCTRQHAARSNWLLTAKQPVGCSSIVGQLTVLCRGLHRRQTLACRQACCPQSWRPDLLPCLV